MTLVPRSVYKVPDADEASSERTHEALHAFRTHAAWILLGEPGAGKSEALGMEADAVGGKYLTIAEFISLDIEPDWQNKTLFLDGLDEVRASGGEGGDILLAIRKQLNKLGKPPFRLACRAADWYGSSDREDIQAASPDGRITVLQLEPLTAEDILCILHDNHQITDPQSFVEEAGRRGVAVLLENPQMLGLLASAVRDGNFPASREETYALACKKLAEEANKNHRDYQRGQSFAIEKLLDAAGQLCAVLLLSDKSGVALDMASANSRFLCLDDFSPPDMTAAAQAVRRKLFRPDGEERMVPSHRSVAEYLAARWLAQQIDQKGLPLGRVLNLLLGADAGVVAGLRALFAWLALHCLSARTRLIDADPFTVIVYGDVKNIHADEKRRLLANLRREAERYAGFRWDVDSGHAFGALADTGLCDDFLAILQSPDRSEANQSHVDCVLDILWHGEALPELASAALDIVRDDSWWLRVRRYALEVWLKLIDDPQVKQDFLDEITEGRIPDQEDGLAGVLLRHLYPAYLAPEELPKHFHPGKIEHDAFWEYALPRLAPDAHLPALLDGFAERPELVSDDVMRRDFNRMADSLLARAIVAYGDSITPERLFVWLGIGADDYGTIQREKNAQQIIAQWLSARPDRYKALLAHCFSLCGSDEYPDRCFFNLERRLYCATSPDDLGLWHLEQASATASDALTNIHLSRAVRALVNQTGNTGLSLEQIELWGRMHPEKQDALDSFLSCEIDEWRIGHATHQREFAKKQERNRRERAVNIIPLLAEIKAGTASSYAMHLLAGVWADRFMDTHGATPLERFNKYCENGDEVLVAAEAGFRLCLNRPDLPTVDEIIQLNIQKKEHYVRLPCLIGMDFLWQDDPAGMAALDDETLRRMIAFRLTYSIGESPEWFLYLVRHRANLVAEILIAYASATLKAGQDYVNSIYPLEHSEDYRAVAIIAAPRLLETFPVRARTGQLSHLECLLKAALRYTPEVLPVALGKKLALKGMDVAQKVYWLATEMLLDPQSNEETLWRYIGKAEIRANHLSGFLYNDDRRSGFDYELPVATMGKLVELLAPHAEMDWGKGDGFVTNAMRRGDHVRALINRLALITTPEAAQELDRLLGLASLQKIRRSLESARHQQTLRRREAEFRFPMPAEVAPVLANQAPTSAADLAALALDVLDEIAINIRRDNDDGFHAFWNVWTEGTERKQRRSRREENLCRDALLTRLHSQLKLHGISCQPEVDHANDKRADLCLFFGNCIELPIEIKRDDNKQMWTGLRDQLIGQYAISPRAEGYGIYLVLWFGEGKLPKVTDGDKKPRTAEELKSRLEAQLQPLERQRIFVRVLDVSWPG